MVCDSFLNLLTAFSFLSLLRLQLDKEGIAVSGLSAKPIRDRQSQTLITTSKGCGFLHWTELLDETNFVSFYLFAFLASRRGEPTGSSLRKAAIRPHLLGTAVWLLNSAEESPLRVLPLRQLSLLPLSEISAQLPRAAGGGVHSFGDAAFRKELPIAPVLF